MRSGQRGMTFLGVLMMLVIIGVVVLFGLKLIPIYLESFKIDKALTSVIEDPATRTKTAPQIAKALVKHLDIDSVSRITERNWREHVDISTKKGKVAINVVYTAETHLVSNVSLVVDFDKYVSN